MLNDKNTRPTNIVQRKKNQLVAICLWSEIDLFVILFIKLFVTIIIVVVIVIVAILISNINHIDIISTVVIIIISKLIPYFHIFVASSGVALISTKIMSQTELSLKINNVQGFIHFCCK